MTNALAELPDADLFIRAAELAGEARRRLDRIANPAKSAKFTHDIKAIRDRIHKVRTDKEAAFEAAFPWDMAWLEGMRHTGGLIAAGQEAGTIAKQESGRPDKSNELLHIRDLQIELIESSRWQRLASIHPEDWRTFEEEFYGERREPTLAAALRLADNETPENERPWLRVYNVWNFAKPDERFGIGHPGNIPGQVNMNLNYYLTEPGDLIVDLFAGGGTTLDVCKADDDDYGNRKCMGFDRRPVRPDIKKHDVADGLPDFPRAALVFLDPPYWGQKAGEYSEDPTDLANMPLDAFTATLGTIVKDALSRAARVAVIIGATQASGAIYDHAADLIARFGAPEHRFIVPYSTEQYEAFDVARAKKAKAYLNIYRDLLVWKGQ